MHDQVKPLLAVISTSPSHGNEKISLQKKKIQKYKKCPKDQKDVFKENNSLTQWLYKLLQQWQRPESEWHFVAFGLK